MGEPIRANYRGKALTTGYQGLNWWIWILWNGAMFLTIRHITISKPINGTLYDSSSTGDWSEKPEKYLVTKKTIDGELCTNWGPMLLISFDEFISAFRWFIVKQKFHLNTSMKHILFAIKVIQWFNLRFEPGQLQTLTTKTCEEGLISHECHNTIFDALYGADWFVTFCDFSHHFVL